MAFPFLPDPRRIDRPKVTPELVPILRDQLYLRLPRVVGLVDGDDDFREFVRLYQFPRAMQFPPSHQLTGFMALE